MHAIRRVPVILAALALVLTALAFATAPPAGADAVTVQLLHNNDGESQILTSEEGFGGIARFANLITNLRADAAAEGHDTILVSSGDNFLAGPEFQVGVVDDVFYDAVALNRMGYDAMAIGNHEFDFGPDVLEDFISSFGNPPTWVSTNLDFSA